MTYSEFPNMFVWMPQQRVWRPRKQGYMIGRVTYVPPGSGELYYMRILLAIQKGCTDYDSIKTVNGQIHEIYEQACYALGLLADDKEFIDAIIEACELASGNQLRRLFVSLLVMNTMSKPDVVWNATWKLLSDEILHHKRKLNNLPGTIFSTFTNIIILFSLYIFFVGLQIADPQLQEIEMLLVSNGRSLKEFVSLPQPDMSNSSLFQNNFIMDELNYDKEDMGRQHASMLQDLNCEQLKVYKEIMSAVILQEEGFFFCMAMVVLEKRLCGEHYHVL